MILRRSLFIAAAGVLLGYAGIVSAADADAGKALAGARCAACHGQNGISAIPVYPSLAGQNEAYLASALKAYRNGQRAGGQAAIMQGQAASLTDEQIEDLAAYFARLPAGGQ